MSNPLKKTMVFLGLAEEEYEEQTQDTSVVLRNKDENPSPEPKAHVTPLRRVPQKTTNTAAVMNEILTVHPTEYKDAQTVADSFREGVPVIINLSRMTESDAKRMIDFSSGLATGLGGRIERVTNKVFLLSPEHIAVTGDADETETQSESGSFFVTQ